MDYLSVTPHLGIEVVSCGLFISSGQGTHPDRVLDSYELIVVRKGTLSIWEQEACFEVPQGHALLLYPGQRHRGALPFARDLSFYWIHFIVARQRKGRLGLEVPKLCRVQRFEVVAELFHRYLDDQEAKRLDGLLAPTILLQILCEVGRRPAEAEGVRGTVLVGRVEAYVTHHLAEKLSTARIAQALRTNPDYLNRVFHKVKGVTITDYLNRRRLTDAAGMLREGTEAISEVASACGYASVGHFRRMFLRHHGVTPGVYRRLMARAHVNSR